MLDDTPQLLTNCVEGGRPTFQRKKPSKVENKDDGEMRRSFFRAANNRVKRKSEPESDEKAVKKKFKMREMTTDESPTPSAAVVSSLFHKNPEIPHLEEKNVNQIVERMFSSTKLDDLHVHPYIISNVRQSFGVKQLTAVQEKSIPRILNGEDVLVKSQTGSGKTLAYVIPIVHQLQALEPQINRSSGLFVTVILPTRELALQTFECFQTLLRAFTRIVPACFMGGQKRKSEKTSLRRGINVLVCTPQRLIDHIKNSKQFTLSKLKYLVLDEADRLMDMGYEKDVASIMDEVTKQRNETAEPLVTVLLSATLTQGVQKLAGLRMRDPVTVDISSECDRWGVNHRLVTPSNLRHHFVIVPAKLRLVCLVTFILWKCRCDQHKILVFLPTQDAVDFFTALVSYVSSGDDGGPGEEVEEEGRTGIHISRLHGNMSQQMRNDVFRRMRKADCGVLFATDVCARGLDLPKVDWIVQFSAPASVAEYVHRVGRTARIGSTGDALLLLLPSEVQYVSLLQNNRIKVDEMSLKEVLEALPRVNRGQRKRTMGSEERLESVEEAATSLQLRCERHVESDVTTRRLAQRAFVSLTRSYASYPLDMRTIFNKKDLHLGHLAKGLALRDTPTQLGHAHEHHAPRGSKMASGVAVGGRRQQQTMDVNLKAIVMSEYASGH